jgi:MFS family permease
VSAFWRFWTAAAVSELGSGFTAVALPLTALLLLHASPFEVGLITGSSFLGWALLGLPSGAICQLLPLRGVQISTDLIRAAAIGSVAVSWALGVLAVPQLVAVALTISFCDVLFDVSNSTFLPAVVDRGELNSRNSWMSGLHSTTQVAGPSIAGVFVQLLGPAYTLIVDAVSYVSSAAILATLPRRSQRRPEARLRLTAMIAEGWNYVVRQPIMRACLLDATASNFVSGALMVLIPVYLVNNLHASPSVVGLMLATDGVGGVLGAVVASRLSSRWGSGRATIYGAVFSSLFAILLPIAPGVPGLILFAAGSVGLAVGTVLTSVNTRTYRQVASPPELLSRVMATVRFVSWGVIPVGSFLAGGLATGIGTRATLVIFCLLTWLSPAVLLGSPVRQARELAEPASHS